MSQQTIRLKPWKIVHFSSDGFVGVDVECGCMASLTYSAASLKRDESVSGLPLVGNRLHASQTHWSFSLIVSARLSCASPAFSFASPALSTGKSKGKGGLEVAISFVSPLIIWAAPQPFSCTVSEN
jgi:hypothetical protein